MVEKLITSVIGRVATGAEFSKNISFDEARDVMADILSAKVKDVQAAVALIALRMKRETIAENKGILSAIIDKTARRHAKVEHLIDIGDPYSGYNRSVPIATFLPPLLAELGLACVIHGTSSIAPKYGLTHHHIYHALGVNNNLSITKAVNRIEDKKISWSYIAQQQYCLALYQLTELRNDIIKRTAINTVETLIAPIKGKKTHSILGFVHKPYPPIYAELTNFSGFDTALLIRGVEGSVVPSLRQKGLVISYQGVKEIARVEITPDSLGIKQNIRAINLPNKNITDLAKYSASLGIEAINGKKGAFYDALVYSCSYILWHIKYTDSITAAADIVRDTLNSAKIEKRIR